MTTQLYLARGIAEGRTHSTVDRSLLRNLELARAEERRLRRERRVVLR